ncbi:MAG: Hsp70 family protein [Opitutales bacterium]|nr:Hsp70 family protein [Opitutales bacterium]
MSARPAFSVGIDLGTTHCALACVPLDGSGTPSAVVAVPQLDSLDTVIRDTVLPSVLYLPTEAERARLPGRAAAPDAGRWIAGRIAHRRAAEAPGRVVHSSKSWLANPAVAPGDRILPADSPDLPAEVRISPVDAAAALLAHLRAAWEAAYADHPASPRFADQSVTVTVPASFTAAAQRATLDAAVRAGFPTATRLLEEPQAAFYRYLEARAGGAGNAPALPNGVRHVLVVDVGGGTSDFSLFRAQDERSQTGNPALERVAVSEHILLGGDNIDLAAAHVLESVLAPDGGSLGGTSWDHLVARARDLKEKSLGGNHADAADGALRVSVPGTGSGLLAGTLSAEIPGAQLREILLEGFFPLVAGDAVAERDRSALREWGLPYASDFAVTRYLAEFLRGQPPVDAVLFNGGSLASPLIRQRLLEQIARWQEGRRPTVLDNPEPGLAVARGAAHYGRVLFGPVAARIAAGAGHAVFLEIEGKGKADGTRRVCLLPRGTPPDETVTLRLPGLRVRVNRPVRFQALQSHRHTARPGEAVESRVEDDAGWVRLPALESEIRLADAGSGETVCVHLESRINELGLLRVEVVADDASVHERWPLEFNLRATEEAPAPTRNAVDDAQIPSPRESAEDAAWAQARDTMLRAFERARAPRDQITPARVLKRISAAMGTPPRDWPLPAIRLLADTLLASPPVPDVDPAHLETWLHLTGFFLRPGFGDPRDPERLDALWEGFGNPSALTSKRVRLQVLILWRRLAAGLPPDRQSALLRAIEPAAMEPAAASEEHIRLAGALERIPPDRKTALAERCTAFIARAARDGTTKNVAAAVDTVGRLLNRAPFHAPDAYVTPPDTVRAAFAALPPFDNARPELRDLPTVFLRAARKVRDPALNLPPKVSRAVIARLAKAGIPETRLAPLRDYILLPQEERAELYSESLPPGLVLVPAVT